MVIARSIPIPAPVPHSCPHPHALSPVPLPLHSSPWRSWERDREGKRGRGEEGKRGRGDRRSTEARLLTVRPRSVRVVLRSIPRRGLLVLRIMGADGAIPRIVDARRLGTAVPRGAARRPGSPGAPPRGPSGSGGRGSPPSGRWHHRVRGALLARSAPGDADRGARVGFANSVGQARRGSTGPGNSADRVARRALGQRNRGGPSRAIQRGSGQLRRASSSGERSPGQVGRTSWRNPGSVGQHRRPSFPGGALGRESVGVDFARGALGPPTRSAVLAKPVLGGPTRSAALAQPARNCWTLRGKPAARVRGARPRRAMTSRLALFVDGHVARSHDQVVEGQRVCVEGWRPLLTPLAGATRPRPRPTRASRRSLHREPEGPCPRGARATRSRPSRRSRSTSRRSKRPG